MPGIFFNGLPKAKQYLLALVLVVAVAAACFPFAGILGYRVVAFILLVTVSLLAMFLDILPVLLSAFLSALIWDFFFIPPRFTIYVNSAEDTFMLTMYFVIALVNAVLTFKIRQIEKLARQKEEKEATLKLYNVLFNSLSHELKTPIATVIGATDSLLNDSDKLSDKNKHTLLSEISIASERLNEQVKNLLNISRIESGYIQPVMDWCDVNELVYSVVNTLENKLVNRTLNINISEKLPLFKLDAGLMEQVLYNLLSNALIYTPESAAISISADCVKEVKGHFTDTSNRFTVRRDSVMSNLIIEVSDTGPGFPANELEKVFDKFYRLNHSKTGGTGLGLSIARGFVEAHKGTIQLTNNTHGGAKFIIRIPAESSYLKTEK